MEKGKQEQEEGTPNGNLIFPSIRTVYGTAASKPVDGLVYCYSEKRVFIPEFLTGQLFY